MASITVKFNGIWRLYLGTDRALMDAADIETALAKIEKEYAIKLEEKFKERGVKLQKSILDYSYIVLNGKNTKTLRERSLRDGDVMDLFIAVPGG
jgi:molybdopterin converting factor small subunit